MAGPVSQSSSIVSQQQTPWIIDEKVNLIGSNGKPSEYTIQITSRLEKFALNTLESFSSSLKAFNSQIDKIGTSSEMREVVKKFPDKQYPGIENVRLLRRSQPKIYKASKECIVCFKDGTMKKYKFTINSINSKRLSELIAIISASVDLAEQESMRYYEKDLMKKINKRNKHAGFQELELEIIPMNIIVTPPEDSQKAKAVAEKAKVSVAGKAPQYDPLSEYHKAKQRLDDKKVHLGKLKNARVNLSSIKKQEKVIDRGLEKLEIEIAKLSSAQEPVPADKEKAELLKEKLDLKLRLQYAKKELIHSKVQWNNYLIGQYKRTPYKEGKELPPAIGQKMVKKIAELKLIEFLLSELNQDIEVTEDLFLKLRNTVKA